MKTDEGNIESLGDGNPKDLLRTLAPVSRSLGAVYMVIHDTSEDQ